MHVHMLRSKVAGRAVTLHAEHFVSKQTQYESEKMNPDYVHNQRANLADTSLGTSSRSCGRHTIHGMIRLVCAPRGCKARPP